MAQSHEYMCTVRLLMQHVKPMVDAMVAAETMASDIIPPLLARAIAAVEARLRRVGPGHVALEELQRLRDYLMYDDLDDLADTVKRAISKYQHAEHLRAQAMQRPDGQALLMAIVDQPGGWRQWVTGKRS